MSGLSSIPILNKRGALLLITLLIALLSGLISGCGGGGGGNGNSGTGTTTTGTGTGTTSGTGGVPVGNAAVTGKVVTAAGDPVPAATIIPDSGGIIATTVSQGSYRLDGLTGDVVHRITASATVGNTNYTGSTEVLTLSGGLVSNANILLSQQGTQATLTGHVTDASRLTAAGAALPIAQARVYIAVPNNANYSSLVAYTDSNGAYSIPNIPLTLPTTAKMQVAISVANYSNQSYTITLPGAGTFGQDFILQPSTNQSLNTPILTALTASTQPSTPLSSNLRARVARAGSVYEQIRRLLCPAYAKTVSGHSAANIKRMSAHLTGGFGTYAIETDLTFDNTAQAGSLLAYTVYRTQGTIAPVQTNSEIYDILEDPLANFYSDIDPSYQPSKQYNFALSATNTDQSQSALSNVLAITPLGSLSLVQPTTGELLSNNVTITWTPVTGVTRYNVFVYDQLPVINTSPVAVTNTSLTATTSRYTLTGPLVTGSDYYVVVVGSADQVVGKDSTGANITVQNAVMTFSPITRFHVP